MTLHDGGRETEVGVRELHDHLSRYVQMVKDGSPITITMRGKPVARLVGVDEQDPFAELRARGLIQEPTAPRRRSRRDRVQADGTVSDLVAE